MICAEESSFGYCNSICRFLSTEFATPKYDYFKLIIFKKQQTKSSESWAWITLFQETFTFLREISICEPLSPCTKKRRMTKSLEILISESYDLNLPNNLILLIFLIASHNWLPPQRPTSSFAFSWRWDLRWWPGLFGEVTQFSWVSLTYTGVICVFKLLFVFLLLICPFSLQRGLSQEPRQR